MKPAELSRELAAGKLRPAYLLAGSELLLRDDALAAIEAAALEGAARDFDRQRIEGASARPGELLDALGTLPVLAPRRLVWLREPEARRGAAGRALLDALADALPGLAERDDVVLVVSAARPDGRARWTRAFKEPAVRVACDPPRPGRELQACIAAEARRQQLELGRGAAEALAERVGPQLLQIRQELEKASLHAGIGERIERAHVLATASDVAEAPLWDLTDAIGEGRTAAALSVLDRLLAAGTPPPMLLGSLATHYRKLARIRTGGRVAGHPFAIKKLERQAARHPAARFVGALRAIHGADEALKGAGALTPELTLERLVLGLAR